MKTFILVGIGLLFTSLLPAEDTTPPIAEPKSLGARLLDDLRQKTSPAPKDSPASTDAAALAPAPAASPSPTFKAIPAPYRSPLGESKGLSTSRLEGAKPQTGRSSNSSRGSRSQEVSTSQSEEDIVSSLLSGLTGGAVSPTPAAPAPANPAQSSAPNGTDTRPPAPAASNIVQTPNSTGTAATRHVLAVKGYMAETYVQNPQGFPVRVSIPITKGQRYPAAISPDRVVLNAQGFFVTVPADVVQLEDK